MLIAGHETSATVLTWLTWRLSSRPAVQHRLRAEVRAARRAALNNGLDETPTEELEKLPYLDAVVVRQSLYRGPAGP